MNVSNIQPFLPQGKCAIPQTSWERMTENLAAQLQYQDPLSGNNMSILQLAQLPGQIQNLNNSITEICTQVLQYGSQLVGKTVTITTEP